MSVLNMSLSRLDVSGVSLPAVGFSRGDCVKTSLSMYFCEEYSTICTQILTSDRISIRCRNLKAGIKVLHIEKDQGST